MFIKKKYVFIILFVIASTLLLFQNFSNTENSLNKHSRNWAAYSLNSMPKNSQSTNETKLCDIDSAEWVITIRVQGVNPGDIITGSLHNRESDEFVLFDQIRLPHTIGGCEAPAEFDEIKICFSNEIGYEYLLDLNNHSTSAKTDVHVLLVKELGCNSLPQLVEVSMGNISI